MIVYVHNGVRCVPEDDLVRLQLQLDAIEGWATDQPGEPPPKVDGWSTAFAAAVARDEKLREQLAAARRKIRRMQRDVVSRRMR